MADITSLKISKDINTDLMIVSRLIGKSKEQLTQDILKEGLKPYLEGIARQRFK